MRTASVARQNMFQYTTPTVIAKSPNGDVYELDASALNAYIRRAWSAIDRGWKYQIGGNIDPKLEAEFIVQKDNASGQTDCSGFNWWATYRKRLGTLYPDNANWKEVVDIIPGVSLRYDAQPGNKFGHVIFVANVLSGGNLETLDMTSDGSGNSGIFYRGPDGRFFGMDKTQLSKKTANQSWLSQKVGGIHAMVSTDAIKSINGIPYKKAKANLLLLAAKQSVTNWLAIGVAFAGIAYYWYKYRNKE
jgi:hypothetical protein